MERYLGLSVLGVIPVSSEMGNFARATGSGSQKQQSLWGAKSLKDMLGKTTGKRSSKAPTKKD